MSPKSKRHLDMSLMLTLYTALFCGVLYTGFKLVGQEDWVVPGGFLIVASSLVYAAIAWPIFNELRHTYAPRRAQNIFVDKRHQKRGLDVITITLTGGERAQVDASVVQACLMLDCTEDTTKPILTQERWAQELGRAQLTLVRAAVEQSGVVTIRSGNRFYPRYVGASLMIRNFMQFYFGPTPLSSQDGPN